MTNAPSCLRPRPCVLAFLFTTVLASTAAAQEATLDAGGGVPLYREAVVCQYRGDAKDLNNAVDKLRTSYYALKKDDWETFQKTAAGIVKDLKCEGGTALPAADDAWYFFLFPEIREVSGREALQVTYRRALVHSAPSPAFQSTRIIFDHDIALYDVHITPYKDGAPPGPMVDTDYTATPVEDPVVGGIKKALALVVANWQNLGFAKGWAPPQPKFKVSVTKLELPSGLDRASITLKDSVEDASATGSSTYYLAPLTYLEIGLGAAYITRTALNQAAKVDSSMNLVDATPTTLLTYVAANWRPWGYDESVRRRDWRQDFRLAIGPALTPNPGFVFGVGYAPWASLRPISIQAGFGILLVNVLRGGDALGKPPQNPAHPTKRGGLGVWFIGLGYGLQ